jgi:spore photoproduct lyase
MVDFTPERVYYEPDVLKYALGKELMGKYQGQGIGTVEIENHNNIPELRAEPNAAFARLKKYLVLGVRKSLRFVPNEKTSDYLVPYTSSGCPAMCLYCYLVCNYFQCAYLRVFVNREQMMEKIIKTAQESPKQLVFEIGSNSDLVMENTVTGNLNWTVERFKNCRNGMLTFPTKFHMVDGILGLPHRGRVTVRMSVNPEYVVKHIEFGTSPLNKRIEALIRLHEAGYATGLLIAPVVLLEGWEKMYGELVTYLADVLPPDLKRGLKIEVILMTYGPTHRAINEAAFPGAVSLYDPGIMKPGGMRKYRYEKDTAAAAKDFLYNLISGTLSESEIAYIC